MAGKNGSIDRATLIIVISFIIVAFIALTGSYGVTFDEMENFGIGQKNLNFYLTGHLNYTDDLPQIADSPNIYNQFVKLYPYHQWPLPNLISAITFKVFHQHLGLLPPVEAYHLANLFFVLILAISLFWFTNKYLGLISAISSLGFLLTLPRLFADYFNNTKDVPLVSLFSLTLFLFFDWFVTRKPSILILTVIAAALTLATKPDAVYLPPIILLFLIIGGHITKLRPTRQEIILLIVAITFSGLLIWVLFPELLPVGFKNFNQYQLHLREQLNLRLGYIRWIGVDPKEGFNLYAPIYILLTTPLLTLMAMSAGIITAFTKKKPIYYFLLVWIFAILLRHCLPGTNHYNGIRHFLVVLVPLSIFASLPIHYLWKRSRLIGILMLIVILVSQTQALLSSHPYQNTYFNPLIGGLGGAQAANWVGSSDYWLSSYRQAINWLNHKTTADSQVTTPVQPDLLRFYPLRTGLSLASPGSTGSSYLITADPTYDKGSLLYREFRQGGIIFSIFVSP